MVWNYFVIYGPYGYKWLAKGWRMALVYALSEKEFTYLESFFVERMVCTLEAASQIGIFGLPFAEHFAVKTQYFALFPSDLPLLSTSRVVNFAQTSILNKLWRGSGFRKFLYIFAFFVSNKLSS